jgi:hypothetical protein
MFALSKEEQAYADLNPQRPPTPPSPFSVSMITILSKVTSQHKAKQVAEVHAKVVPKFNVHSQCNKFGRTWTPGSSVPSTSGPSAAFRRGGAGAALGHSRREKLDPLPGKRAHTAEGGRHRLKRTHVRSNPKRESTKLPPSTTTRKVCFDLSPKPQKAHFSSN